MPVASRSPSSHSRTTRQYPVVVVFDGESIFGPVAAAAPALARVGFGPEAVVVGIENTDRRPLRLARSRAARTGAQWERPVPTEPADGYFETMERWLFDHARVRVP